MRLVIFTELDGGRDAAVLGVGILLRLLPRHRVVLYNDVGKLQVPIHDVIQLNVLVVIPKRIEDALRTFQYQYNVGLLRISICDLHERC